jgi:hypothetical protein
VLKSHASCLNSTLACISHTHGCRNHTPQCHNNTLRAEITHVRVEITVVSVVITFVRVKYFVCLRMNSFETILMILYYLAPTGTSPRLDIFEIQYNTRECHIHTHRC